MRRIAGREDRLHQQQTAIRPHGLMTVTEDRQTLRLVPIMDDVREHIRIPTRRHLHKEIAHIPPDFVVERARRSLKAS